MPGHKGKKKMPKMGGGYKSGGKVAAKKKALGGMTGMSGPKKLKAKPKPKGAKTAKGRGGVKKMRGRG